MKILIKGCRVVDPFVDYPESCDILIEDGIIAEVRAKIEADVELKLDANGLEAMPGFIDMHTHLRQPGYEYKETVLSGTMAAARGGYTSICCMPNTKPVIDNLESLRALLQLIEKDAVVNVYPIAAISIGQKGEELTDMTSLKNMGAIAFSDDGHPVASKELLRNAMLLSKQRKLLLIDHCEDLRLVNGGVVNEGDASCRLKLKGISAASEEASIERDIAMAEQLGASIHIAHISTKGSAEIIRAAKRRGVQVSCEVTPHHLALTDEIISEGYTDCKVNPPLRTLEDAKALIEALCDGTIDVIATDHAPHSTDDKSGDFYSAAFGISGIETAFTVCNSVLVSSGNMTLRELSMKMSYMPAKLLGLKAGRIAKGYAADIAVVNSQAKIVIDKELFLSKGRNTPFHGSSCTGEILYTICGGKLVYSNKSINNEEVK